MVYEEQPEQHIFDDKIILKSKTDRTATLRHLFSRLDDVFAFLFVLVSPLLISSIILYTLNLLYTRKIIGGFISILLSIIIILYTIYFYRRYSLELIQNNFKNLVELHKHVITNISEEGIRITIDESINKFKWNQIEEICRYIYTKQKKEEEKYQILIEFNKGDFISIWDNETWDIYKKILRWSKSMIQKIGELAEV